MFCLWKAGLLSHQVELAQRGIGHEWHPRLLQNPRLYFFIVQAQQVERTHCVQHKEPSQSAGRTEERNQAVANSGEATRLMRLRSFAVCLAVHKSR